MIEMPVAAVKRDGMIVDLARNPELVIYVFCPLLMIQLEFIGLHRIQLL